MERGKKELFFVQKILIFVQKIKKRPDIFRQRQRTADNIASKRFRRQPAICFPHLRREKKGKKKKFLFFPCYKTYSFTFTFLKTIRTTRLTKHE